MSVFKNTHLEKIENLKSYIAKSPDRTRSYEDLIEEENAFLEEGPKNHLGRYNLLFPENYTPIINQIEDWKIKYEESTNETFKIENSKIESFYQNKSKQDIELKIKFLVQNKGPVEIIGADWSHGGVAQKTGVNFMLLAAIFLNPKRLQEVANLHASGALTYDYFNSYAFNDVLYCGRDVVGGCAPQKK